MDDPLLVVIGMLTLVNIAATVLCSAALYEALELLPVIRHLHNRTAIMLMDAAAARATMEGAVHTDQDGPPPNAPTPKPGSR